MTLKSIKRKYTKINKIAGSARKAYYDIWLNIDHQHFLLAYQTTEKKEATWMRNQLATALYKLVETDHD
jgi:hypothetical protein